jgi:ABC-type uncharacterized transport system substrate-binding protein
MKITVAAVLVACLSVASLQAHPHAYLICNSSLVMDQAGIAAVRIQWTFDPAFSKAVVAQADRNGDGALDATETASLPALTQSELVGVQSSLQLKVNDKIIAFDKKSSPAASYDGSRLQFTMDVPLRLAVSETGASVRVSLIDPSYFCEVSISDDIAPVSLAGRFAVTSEVRTNLNESFYFGSLHPEEIWLSAKPAGAKAVAVAASSVPSLSGNDLELPLP